MVNQDFILVGHRGTGKTTVANALALRGWQIVDLDTEIERSGRTCAQIIAQDGEARFRAIEQETLSRTMVQDAKLPRVFVLGGGCFPIPEAPICIWLRRSDWERVAIEERARLWPELSAEQELAKMRQEREPRYAAAADLIYDLERGGEVRHAATQLDCLMRWTQATGDLARESYLVVPSPELLRRCELRVRRLGLAGLELRSDVFETIPDVAVPFIASVRTDDVSWLNGAGAAAIWDIDLAYLDEVRTAGLFEAFSPRPLILSSHMRHNVEGPTILSNVRMAFREAVPAWAPGVITKYAPTHIESYAEVAELINMRGTLGGKHVLLPQGRRWAWLRPILGLRSNYLNYIGLGVTPSHSRQGSSLPPWDLRDWLPHLGLQRGSRFDALIGEPVDHSQGDIWHRHAAERVGLNVGYLRLSVSVEELEAALGLARQLGIFNLSATSPLKFHAAEAVVNEEAPIALNTLIWRTHGWHGWDTDAEGLCGALKIIEERGVNPGTIAIIGRGGVSAALKAAIDASDWEIVFHAGARQGWTSAPQEVDLVINASGDRDVVYQGPPQCKAWLDLHYVDVRQPPPVAVHLNGDAFFEAQARAQRRVWGYPTK